MPREKVRAASPLAQACALVAAAFGLAALLGWALALPLLSSPDARWIPMAPSSALLFMLFGGVLFLCARAPPSRALRRVALGMAAGGGLIALLLLVLSVQGVRLDAEHLGFSVQDKVNGAETGHMSPVTALCFMLAAASLLATLVSSRARSKGAMAGFWLACTVTALGAFFLLAYLFGRPLLYSGQFIPLAFTSSLAIVALGTALSAFAGSRSWPFEREDDAESLRSSHIPIFVFAALGAGLVATGYFYTGNHIEQYRAEVGEELLAVADLKADDLGRWRAERLRDASSQFQNQVFSALVARAFARQPDAQAQLQGLLEHILESRQYARAVLMNAEGRETMSVPRNALLPGIAADAPEAMRTGEVRFVDLHRDSKEGAVHLALLVPLLDPNRGERPLGLLYLGIDPQVHLNPFLERWPKPSRSAETLLVRRDGDDVLFLNELRFQKNAALSLRIPLASADVPAVQAALGRQGIVEGRDYRGVEVIAGLRKVPGSPWFLVARMDSAEALAPAYAQLWMLTGVVGALLLAAAAATGFAWRHQRARHYRQQYQSAAALASSLKRHRAITQTATDAIIAADAAGAIVAWNPAATRIFGYAEAEVIGQPITLLMPQRYRDLHQGGMRKVAEGEQHALFRTLELHGLTKAGEEFPLELSLSCWESAEGVFFTSIIRDITERKRAEAALARLSDLYNLLSHTNLAVVHTTGRDELFPVICRHAVEFGRFRFAWIGIIGAADGRVRPVAQYGEDAGYVSKISASADAAQPGGGGGIGHAIRSGKRVVSNDFANDPSTVPWHEAARSAGVRAAAALPLRLQGAVTGVMCLYADAPGFFTEDMHPTLDEMARDISFALDNFAREAERKHIQEKLQERERSLREAQEVGQVGSYVFDIAGDVWESSAVLDAILGIGAEFPRSMAGWAQIVHPAEREQLVSYLREIIATRQPFTLEYRIVRVNDGAERWVSGLGKLRYGVDGKAMKLVGSIQDITERKQAEAARAALEAGLRESQKMEALGTLAGGVAHDFNNALAAIIGNVELARQDVGPAHPALDSLEEIDKASRRAKNLVQQILAFGRRQMLERKVISLAPVVEEVVRLLRATLPAAVNLVAQCREDAPAVLADAMQIEQMLLNLCTNAWHSIRSQVRPGRIEIRLEACNSEPEPAPGSKPVHGALRPGRYACLSVCDNGLGMNAATQGHMFEPFFTTKSPGEGTGLGLSVVYGIAQAHQAIIQVHSRSDEGATFRIYFPAASAPVLSIAAPAPAPGRAVAGEAGATTVLPAVGERVLYVDDDEAIVYLMTRLLERRGYRVSGYTDPREALAAVRADPDQFDLTVTDYNMPGMSGLEVVRALREIRADLPIVMASGYITEELRVEAHAAGVSELVFKPNTIDDLCDAVERHAQVQSGKKKTG
ncbi:MAG: PAS domain S-box protein [Proteobacteria bacterium]|nr:PAS domain S-box protein [Pseudomonadota bacterium]